MTRESKRESGPRPPASQRATSASAQSMRTGLAIHRNFDYYHGSKIRGMTREKPFLHVIGLRRVLEEWGRHHGLRPEWIQPEKRRKVAHYDVFGPSAELLIARVKGTN